MTKEVMKLALEALKNTTPSGFNMETDKRFYLAIEDLEEALKQEQGEPVGEAYLCDCCLTPFDGAYECPSCGHNSSTKEPVYTTPQTKEWVGLTADQMTAIAEWQLSAHRPLIDVIKAVEQALREKNT